MDGFYIGRYEVGDNDYAGSVWSRPSSASLTNKAVITQGKCPYFNINWFQAYDICREFSGTSESVESCLIYGCLWDATMEYLAKSGNKTYYEIAVDSTSWGNYKTSTFSYINYKGEEVTRYSGDSCIIPTGSTEYTKVCNIYDLSGNLAEITQEKYINWNHYRYIRGNSWADEDGEVSKRDYKGTVKNGYNNIGCRAILYIK